MNPDQAAHERVRGVPFGLLVSSSVGVLREFVDDDHQPEYATLVLRDAHVPGTAQATGAVPRLWPAEAHPGGTIARATAGELEGNSRSGHHVVPACL